MISKLNAFCFLSKSVVFLICIAVFFANLNASDTPSVLMEAIESGDSAEKIGWLINSGEDVNEVYIEFLRAVKPVLRYALDRVNDREYMEIIENLMDSGADVNSITYNRVTNKRVYGMMPLISYAVIYSSPEVVRIFIDHGADVNYKLSKASINSNKTALTYAKELGKEEIADMLEKAGALPNID